MSVRKRQPIWVQPSFGNDKGCPSVADGILPLLINAQIPAEVLMKWKWSRITSERETVSVSPASRSLPYVRPPNLGLLCHSELKRRQVSTSFLTSIDNYAYNQGLEHGQTQDSVEAYRQGHEEGHEQAWEEAYEEGHDQGWGAAYSQGQQEGYTEGLRRGRAEEGGCCVIL